MSGESISGADGLDVSRETLDDLLAFRDLVLKWNDAINLVSRASLTDLWRRHIVDSAQLADLVTGLPETWVDIGSGGGFPAIVSAIQFKTTSPQTKFTLIESDLRKATFLRQAIRTYGLNAEVLAQRVETVKPIGAKVLSARALAPLAQLLGHAKHHLATDGRAFFLKGETFTDEIDLAKQTWTFRVRAHTSRTDGRAAILEVDQIDKI